MTDKMKWRPIETAPKSGRFLVYGGVLVGEVPGMDQPPKEQAIFLVDGETSLLPEYSDGASDDDIVFWVPYTDFYSVQVVNPTHWMPLPEPPKED